MAFNEQIAGEIVRTRLGLSSQIPILWAIPEALKRFSRKIAANPKKRPLLLTKRDDVSVVLDSEGNTNLTAIVDFKILIEFLEHGTIWFRDGDSGAIYQYPLQKIRNPQFAEAHRTFGNEYYYYWLDGFLLRTKQFAKFDDPLSGNLLFAVPYEPTMAQLSAIPELYDDFIDKLIEVFTAGQTDAEDEEH